MEADDEGKRRELFRLVSESSRPRQTAHYLKAYRNSSFPDFRRDRDLRLANTAWYLQQVPLQTAEENKRKMAYGDGNPLLKPMLIDFLEFYLTRHMVVELYELLVEGNMTFTREYMQNNPRQFPEIQTLKTFTERRAPPSLPFANFLMQNIRDYLNRIAYAVGAGGFEGAFFFSLLMDVEPDMAANRVKIFGDFLAGRHDANFEIDSRRDVEFLLVGYHIRAVEVASKAGVNDSSLRRFSQSSRSEVQLATNDVIMRAIHYTVVDDDINHCVALTRMLNPSVHSRNGATMYSAAGEAAQEKMVCDHIEGWRTGDQRLVIGPRILEFVLKHKHLAMEWLNDANADVFLKHAPSGVYSKRFEQENTVPRYRDSSYSTLIEYAYKYLPGTERVMGSRTVFRGPDDDRLWVFAIISAMYKVVLTDKTAAVLVHLLRPYKTSALQATHYGIIRELVLRSLRPDLVSVFNELFSEQTIAQYKNEPIVFTGLVLGNDFYRGHVGKSSLDVSIPTLLSYFEALKPHRSQLDASVDFPDFARLPLTMQQAKTLVMIGRTVFSDDDDSYDFLLACMRIVPDEQQYDAPVRYVLKNIKPFITHERWRLIYVATLGSYRSGASFLELLDFGRLGQMARGVMAITQAGRVALIDLHRAMEADVAAIEAKDISAEEKKEAVKQRKLADYSRYQAITMDCLMKTTTLYNEYAKDATVLSDYTFLTQTCFLLFNESTRDSVARFRILAALSLAFPVAVGPLAIADDLPFFLFDTCFEAYSKHPSRVNQLAARLAVRMVDQFKLVDHHRTNNDINASRLLAEDYDKFLLTTCVKFWDIFN